MSDCKCDTKNKSKIFPSMLGCVVKKSYTAQKPIHIIHGLGARSMAIDRPYKATIMILFYSQQDVDIFRMWGKEELENWALPFEIELPIFGTPKKHKVRFLNAIKEYDLIGNTRKISGDIVVVGHNNKCEKLC